LVSPQEILEKHWGYKVFKPKQQQIIEAVLNGYDTLGLLPTGGGKSICYQVPALMLGGISIVVTPLIALMKDQAMNLVRRKIPALAIHSGMSMYEIEETFRKVERGEANFLFVSPERLAAESFQERSAEWPIKLLVVDEAHCISEWGYDFRPSYLLISEYKALFPHITTLALTASATVVVQQDISEKLLLQKPKIFQTGVFRDNLSLSSRLVDNKEEKILEVLSRVKGSALIYCKNRISTHKLQQYLLQQGISCLAYNGGMEMQERNKVQDAWIKNEVRIITCTNAFGMGIDKPDVRLVIHYHAPESLEAYYQEVGRAGRDGVRSYGVLLYRHDELSDIDYKVAQRYPDVKKLAHYYQTLGDYLHISHNEGADVLHDFDIVHFCKAAGFESVEAYNALKILEQQDLIRLNEGIHFPPKLLINADRDDLAYLEIHQPIHFAIITAALRLYAGITHAHISIQEHKIAQLADVDVQVVKQFLQQLQSMAYVQYIPLKDKPQLSFAQDRFHPYDLRMDTDLLYKLRDRYRLRLRNMYLYIEQAKQCRMEQLSNYFGNAVDEPCAICDNCIRAQKQALKQQQFEQIASQIKTLISTKEHSIKDIIITLHQFTKTEIELVATALIEEGVLVVDQFGIIELSQ
jgi:ATP-dependent DNA helicase RecQ